ncbi:MAG: beta-galactosidase trimerization domain-containing protein [Armatimonadota bacterium]
MNRSAAIVLAAAIALASPGSWAQSARRITVPMLERGPELRGDLSDPAWSQAAVADGFVQIDTGARPGTATRALLLADAEYLYVGFDCEEPLTGQMVLETSGTDGPVAGDDCVGVVIDPPNGDTWAYEVLANSGGVTADALHAPAGTDRAWNSGTRARAQVGEGRWCCELAVPFAALGGPARPGETWGLNLTRTRRAAGERAGGEELSAWVQAPAGFDDPTACGDALFLAPGGPVGLTVLSRGALSADAADPAMNAFAVSWRNHGAQAVQVQIEVSGAGEPAVAVASVPPGGSATLRAVYPVPTTGRPVYAFAVSVDGAGVYRSELQAVEPVYRGPRTWQVPDPLFAELLSDQPAGLAREGALIWGHLNDVALLRETARRFAVRYSEDEAYQIHAQHKLIFIGHAVIRDLATDSPWTRWRVRNAPTPAARFAAAPWVLDPAAIEADLAQVEEVFAGPHPLVFGIFAGDEVDDYALKQGATLMARPGEYAYIVQADAQVRERFGGGRFGIPAGTVERDPDPYKWIAFRRWCNEVMRERNRRLAEIVRRHAPHMPIISVDGGGELLPLEFSRQAEMFDIFTNQHASRGEPWRCTLGYITKVIADLTGKEVWPCAHVENYGVALTPEEVLEELSQVLRNGGSGLHLYLPDTANANRMVGDTRNCYFGSPRRWHTIMNVVDLLRTLPRPDYPDYDRTAIVFNDDTLMAAPYDADRPWNRQTEACYTMLGPVARSWFRFIDAAQVQEWDDLRARFDIIYLPCARYQRPAVVDRLEGFVRAGGTLVCADPLAFETDLVANDTTARREAIFGVTVGEAIGAASLRFPDDLAPTPLALTAEAYALQPAEGVEVLARYDNGSPAVTAHRLGAGRAILFGSNPFSLAAVRDEAWREFFAAWVARMGAPTGLDIWRLKLPDSLIWREPEPPGVCLTNNSVIWREERPHSHLNRDTGGSYSFSVAPDAMPDAAGAGQAIEFPAGHLTDRRQAIRARKIGTYRAAPYALPASRWMASWQTTEPVSVTFDLGAPYLLRELRLWFCDDLPQVTAQGSADGEAWHAAGRAAARQAGEDVLEEFLALDLPEACRYLRVSFAAREPGRRMTLVEAEVWGEAAAQ